MTTGRRRADSSGEDKLLSRLYEQVTEREAARFAAGYDMAAGLDRYKAWLDEHTAREQPGSLAIPGSVSAADRFQLIQELLEARVAAVGSGRSVDSVSWEVLTAGTQAGVARPTDVTETFVAPVPLVSVTVRAGAARAVTLDELFYTHYRSLVRLAALLVRDYETAEVVVQDAFVAMQSGFHRPRDNDKALAYLRQSVVNRSRSVLRDRQVVDRNAPKLPPDEPSAERGAFASFERTAVIAALRSLPAQQREALVLRFYADLSEAQIAEAMGISRGAVKSHTARAMQALRTVLERDA